MEEIENTIIFGKLKLAATPTPIATEAVASNIDK
jgi:hypothetical protein